MAEPKLKALDKLHILNILLPTCKHKESPSLASWLLDHKPSLCAKVTLSHTANQRAKRLCGAQGLRIPSIPEMFKLCKLSDQMPRCFCCVPVPGASAFVLSLLEPDPSKRPSVRAAMEERWINEGYAKKPLHTLSHKNRWMYCVTALWHITCKHTLKQDAMNCSV